MGCWSCSTLTDFWLPLFFKPNVWCNVKPKDRTRFCTTDGASLWPWTVSTSKFCSKKVDCPIPPLLLHAQDPHHSQSIRERSPETAKIFRHTAQSLVRKTSLLKGASIASSLAPLALTSRCGTDILSSCQPSSLLAPFPNLSHPRRSSTITPIKMAEITHETIKGTLLPAPPTPSSTPTPVHCLLAMAILTGVLSGALSRPSSLCEDSQHSHCSSSYCPILVPRYCVFPLVK